MSTPPIPASAGTQARPRTAPPAAPTQATFLWTAAALAVLTAVEFGIIYVSGIRYVVIAVLFLLSAVKFSLVALVFMQLRFDHRYLRWIFAGGVLLAVAIAVAQQFVNLA